MREIKFRAWDNRRKQMNYKVCVGNTDMNDENYTCSTILIDGEWVHFDDYCDIVVEQYTGLKDKNGVEIYEGDIVQWSVDADQAGEEPLSDTYTVIYRNGGFYLENHKDVYPKHEPISEVVIFYAEHQVIGNIYENKELLDEQD